MLQVVDRLSWAGLNDYPNEDSCGAAGDWAWVIDTSIFPGTKPVMHEASDARWMADFATERFTDLAPSAADGRELVRKVMQEVRDAFMAVAPPARHDPVTWPLGAMTLVHRRGDLLDAWTFGDTTAYLRRPDGWVATVGEGPELRKAEMAMAAEILKASGTTPRTVTKSPDFRDWLAARRERQKARRDLALLSLDPDAADRLRHETLPCPSGTTILLVSDGFSALVDLYGHVDAAGLMDIALTQGLEPLARAAREIETQIDPTGERYPRFKESDDTTGLLVRAV
jgi:Protein phosphatase 2C